MALVTSAVGDLLLKENSKRTVEAYKSFVDAIFPFAAKNRVDTDKKLVETMQKEAARGPIQFSPILTPNPLQKAAKQMRLPDEFRQKLQQRARRQRR